MAEKAAQLSMETDDSVDEEVPSTSEEQTAERNIQVDNILRVITESIEKLKISLMLPRFFQNPIEVRQSFAGTQYQPCSEALTAFLKKKDANIPAHLNYDLIKLIDTFHRNVGMLQLLPSWVEGFSSDETALLDAFQLMYTIAEQRLRKTAKSELAKEKKLHQIYNKNEQMKNNIEDYEKKLASKKANMRWEAATKDTAVQRYEEDLAFKKWDNSMRIKQAVVLSSRRIRSIRSVSLAKQKELEEELERAKSAYEKLLKSNLKQEMEIRREKAKLLLQLEALIRKYDSNIGDKIKEHMHLQGVYQERKKEFDEFMKEFQRQEMEYNSVIRQKDQEDRRRQEERLILFMMHRAARTIQFHWRRYRRDMKKKSKKGKGKRK